MAIADVAEYAHLSAADVEALAVELDAIRLDIEDSRGTRRQGDISSAPSPFNGAPGPRSSHGR